MKILTNIGTALAIAASVTNASARPGATDLALASCAAAAQFCDSLSYDENLCEETRKALPDCASTTASGVLCRLRLDEIAPTQVSVGMHATECKAKAKFGKKREKSRIHRYLMRPAHQVPVVLGPENDAGMRFYITDHHHLSYALLLAHQKGYTDVDSLYACVLTNRKDDRTKDFWEFMVRSHFTWLDDQEGVAISPADLETLAPELKEMKDDPYRTWSRWVRDSCGYLKAGNGCVPTGYPASSSYFMEFKWADFLEANLPGKDEIGRMSDKEIQSTLKDAIEIAQEPQAYLEDLPGYNGGGLVPVKHVEIKGGCEAD